MTTLSIIAAVAENGVIGRDGGLPWHLPDDLRHFKQLTMGHLLVMGRRTWESVGRPLPGRRIVVLTRRPATSITGALVARSLDQAVTLARPEEEVFVTGGTDVYREALPRADRLYLTVVHARVEGDAVFPPVDWRAWRLAEERYHPADERHAHPFTVRSYVRR